MKRTATAHWEGTGKEGTGHLSTQSTVLDKSQFSWKTRFADGIGTNPEELIGAAHSGCFTMKLSFILNEAGFTATSIDTKSTVTLDNGVITNCHLDVEAVVPGLTAEQFAGMAANAKENCLISKLFNTEITYTAALK